MTTSRPKILKEFEKIAVEAYAEGREPALALRYYEPTSILADVDGWVDLIARRVADDRCMHDELNELRWRQGVIAQGVEIVDD